jgi:peptidoglycan/xylan/chitin deacetylase (PgdA/CDA1 family)
VTAALIYHDIARPDQREAAGFPGPLAARYKLDPERFEDHLDAIAATGRDVGRVGLAGSPPSVALTFDDGGASALAAADAIERRGWRGHFFLVTARIGTPGFLDREGVAELARRGHSVGSHSHTHPTYMGHLETSELDAEWRASRALLEEVLGRPVLSASVPGGFLSGRVVDSAAAAGYGLLMTSEPVSRLRRSGDLLVVGRYTIWASTPSRQAAAYARGERPARARLWLEWKAKRLLKQASPAGYQALRRVRAGRLDRTGDEAA